MSAGRRSASVWFAYNLRLASGTLALTRRKASRPSTPTYQPKDYMNAAKLIRDKRDGMELTDEQIDELIQGFTSEEVPDYQMAAFAMAVFFKGMTPAETTALTKAMINSGETLSLIHI